MKTCCKMAVSSSETCCENLTFESFALWSTNALKTYLHVRSKSIEGNHEDLAARYISYLLMN